MRSVSSAVLGLMLAAVSLNQWIASAVAQKVGAVETAADFFRQKAGGAQPEDLHAFLARAPDRKPDPGDAAC